MRQDADNRADTVLRVENLAVAFDTEEGRLRAVDGVDLLIRRGDALALVGESGCGKTVTAMSILRLLACPPGRIESGRVHFRGLDLLTCPLPQLRAVRGRAIGMIFQEPASTLSPLQRIGRQLVEAQRLHTNLTPAAAWRQGVDWLRKVGLPDPEERMYAYPHQLSGGMAQRVMIALALLHDPELIIADEPTTALDVTIQAQVLDLLRHMRPQHSALLLITHDMGVVRQTCSRIAVMYASQIVETGACAEVFARPLHPYTEALFASIPDIKAQRKSRLPIIPGQVPSPLRHPPGCRFHPRCPYVMERCRQQPPALETLGARSARCFLAAERAAASRREGA